MIKNALSSSVFHSEQQQMAIVDFQNCFIIILLFLCSILCCYSLLLRKQKAGCELPPSPPSLPIIGHLHLLLSLSVHKTLLKLSSEYGPILHLHVFNVPIILISSASIAYEIFKAQDVNISSRSLPTNEGSLFLGSSSFIMAPYGDYWKFVKKLIVTKLLGPQALERSQGVREDEVKRFYSILLDHAVKKESVNICEEVMKLINNSIFKMLVGRSYSEEKGDAERVKKLVTESGALTLKYFLAAMFSKRFKKLGISPFKKELMSISSRFEEVLEKILVEYEDKLMDEGTSEILDELLAACRDRKITRKHIKSLFVDLLFAGTDNSTHAVEWIMAEIINNFYILEKLREEIDLVVGKTRLIQETDLRSLPYLEAVIKEGLRLHPPAPFFERTSQKECKIRGFYVPESTTLVVSSYAVMRDPDLWEDPEEFKPERFLATLETGKEKVPKYIPFGSGRRACPGSNLAYVSIGTAIGVMVQGFEWKTKGNKINMEEASGAMTLSMAHPLKCIPVPRTLVPLT